MTSCCAACTGRARELALTARMFKAQEAKDMGLVTEIFPDMAALQAAAARTAASIAAKSPLAITGTKRVLLHSRCVANQSVIVEKSGNPNLAQHCRPMEDCWTC